MPYLNKKYIWDEMLSEVSSADWSEDTQYIIMDSLDEFIKDLESETVETMDR